MEGFTLSKETQSEINTLRQRAANYANQLAKSFNVTHPTLQLSFSVEASLVVQTRLDSGEDEPCKE